MKTIKKELEIVRVKDVIADHFVKNAGWQYCPKHLFKIAEAEKNGKEISEGWK